MLKAEQIGGHWDTLRGKVKEKWGQLSDDELTAAQGNVDQLVGLIQRRTGEAREAIESFINDVVSSPVMGRAAEVATDYAQATAAKVRQGYDEVKSQVSERAEQLERRIKEQPM